MIRGWIHALRNRPEAAIEASERAQRLSPLDPLSYFGANTMAFAHLVAHRFEQAIDWADRVLHDQPRLTAAIRVKIVANAHLGRLDAARADVARLLEITPQTTIAERRTLFAPFAPEVVELIISGLRKG